ncbi:acetolactate synthase-1/2/3 large subunit [Blastococcus sp. DSM 46786]|uniref:thiamine pyrophosphate-binding protein n=1 Tax=Blastococcus sp. DSM 46786 TaxID=1798227 RepID=UPI0008ACA772|nr:thiamine pyrophosphate-binding protein [Blastococcus sp. DSM 46786]SEK91763.1 acetolactate synthase-1/2/3 large subunit [Blastococcus sp. DSM 46786]
MRVEQPSGLPAERPAAAWGSDLVVDLLAALDVPYVPLNPGSSFRGLHDSLVNHGGNRDPQLLLCLHEEVAVSLAHGWAKATGRLGVAAVHDLVGLQHASMAVYDAFCDRTPLLLLGGSGPADPAQRRPVDWIHSATTQAQLVRDYTVWDAEPVTPAAFVADVTRARQRALSAPQGPAYVSLDAGVQETALDRPVPLPDLLRHAPAPPLAAHPDAVERAVEVLVEARFPVVVAGRVGLDPRATAAVGEVVELLGAAYRDDRNVVVLPTRHGQNATGDTRLLEDADVVLAIDVVDLPALLRREDRGPRGSAGRAGRPGPLVVDLSHGDLGRPSWTNAFGAPLARDVQLLADPLTGLAQLVAALHGRVDPAAAARRREQVADRVRRLRERRAAELVHRWDDRPISPARLVAETWTAVQDVDHLLCLRNTRTWPEGVWELPGAGSYLGHSGGGGVGYGPGALVGGALAARDRGQLGVGIIGDGDLLMASSALWTAAHYRIPALVVVNDNSSFYNDEPHQAEVARHRGRPEQNSWIGMRISDPAVDIAGLARSYGCWAEGPVDDPEDLAGALGRGRDAALGGAVAVVHVRTAPR